MSDRPTLNCKELRVGRSLTLRFAGYADTFDQLRNSYFIIEFDTTKLYQRIIGNNTLLS